MLEERTYREESPVVQAHLGIAQAVIQRMATNSAFCKAWCITLVTAILVIVADKGKPSFALIAGIPVLLFLVLDSYYLALERFFRTSYNEFIDKLHSGKVVASDLYAVRPTGSLVKAVFQSMCSFSLWPFYITLAVMIWFAMSVVIPTTTDCREWSVARVSTKQAFRYRTQLFSLEGKNCSGEKRFFLKLPRADPPSRTNRSNGPLPGVA